MPIFCYPFSLLGPRSRWGALSRPTLLRLMVLPLALIAARSMLVEVAAVVGEAVALVGVAVGVVAGAAAQVALSESLRQETCLQRHSTPRAHQLFFAVAAGMGRASTATFLRLLFLPHPCPALWLMAPVSCAVCSGWVHPFMPRALHCSEPHSLRPALPSLQLAPALSDSLPILANRRRLPRQY